MKTKKTFAFSRKRVARLVFALLAPILFLPVDARTRAQALPEPVVQALKKAKIPVDAVGVYVQPLLRSGKPKISGIRLNESTPFVPASTMKLVVTYSALEILGPAYQWKTIASSNGSQDGEVLNGDLIFRGSGDPRLNLESFWLFLRQIRKAGIRRIHGDLVLDRSAFEARHFDPAAFDNEPFRPYNAGPDALLLNHKVLEVFFRPNGLDGTVNVQISPELEGVSVVPPTLRDIGGCNNWQKEMTPVFSETEVKFEGMYPLSCGEQTWLIYPHSMSDSTFFGAAFAHLWKEMGGEFTGRIRDGAAPQDAWQIAQWFSPVLGEVIRDVNKHSNNVMARHVLMAAGVPSPSANESANPEKGAFAIRSFLASKGIPVNGLHIENGSGLSRTERISPETMGSLLVMAYDSAVMPELMASLPVVGRDGTLRRSLRQTSVAGKAHLKTGAIQDVRAIAGYVLAASGVRYAVVFMVNHPNAASSPKVRDVLLTWIHDNG